MSSLEQQPLLAQKMKQAFDDITMPGGLKEDTLRLLTERRAAEEGIEKERQERAVLSEDSEVVSLLDMPPVAFANKTQRRPRFRRGILVLAASFVLCALLVGANRLYLVETALVEIEVNPSLELGINRFNMVVDARAQNDEGQLVLEQVQVVGKSYHEALALITGSDIFMSYVRDTSFVDISVICEDTRQSANLRARGQESINALPCRGVCNEVSRESYHEAQEAGMGAGRYEVARELMSLDATISLADCQKMSMHELRQRIARIDPYNTYAQPDVKGNRGAAHGRGH